MLRATLKPVTVVCPKSVRDRLSFSRQACRSTFQSPLLSKMAAQMSVIFCAQNPKYLPLRRLFGRREARPSELLRTPRPT
jgi:hypothetical protein